MALGRGNHLQDDHLEPLAGSIPAWAGKPFTAETVVSTTKVYPRVGGETDGVVSAMPPASGLSPRGRGNRLYQPTIRA